jgi:hypothetical protein
MSNFDIEVERMIFDLNNDWVQNIVFFLIGLSPTIWGYIKGNINKKKKNMIDKYYHTVSGDGFINFTNNLLKEYYGGEYFINVFGKEYPTYIFEGIVCAYPFDELCNKNDLEWNLIMN